MDSSKPPSHSGRKERFNQSFGAPYSLEELVTASRGRSPGKSSGIISATFMAGVATLRMIEKGIKKWYRVPGDRSPRLTSCTCSMHSNQTPFPSSPTILPCTTPPSKCGPLPGHGSSRRTMWQNCPTEAAQSVRAEKNSPKTSRRFDILPPMALGCVALMGIVAVNALRRRGHFPQEDQADG